MSRNVTLKSDLLEIVINTHGAELQSIRDKNGREYLWQGDPDIWANRSPILFPICGALKDDKYILDDRKYKLSKHGFAKRLDFKLESQTQSSAVFLLAESEETLVSYPFSFEFRAHFSLLDNKITVTYDVKNNSSSTMYFSCGAHEGYALPEGIDGCKVVFDMPETLNSYKCDASGMYDEYETLTQNSYTLNLCAKDFENKSLIFKELNSRGVTLVNSVDDRRIRVDFEDFEHLLLWQVSGAKYLCVEPWSGLPDNINTDHDFTKKESITALEPDKSISYTHHITILD